MDQRWAFESVPLPLVSLPVVATNWDYSIPSVKCLEHARGCGALALIVVISDVWSMAWVSLPVGSTDPEEVAMGSLSQMVLECPNCWVRGMVLGRAGWA
jgi:hypothetical protein